MLPAQLDVSNSAILIHVPPSFWEQRRQLEIVRRSQGCYTHIGVFYCCGACGGPEHTLVEAGY